MKPACPSRLAPLPRGEGNLLLQAWKEAWQPHDRRPMHEWALDYIDLPETVYAEPGPLDLRKSRYLIEPCNARDDDSVRVVTAQKGTQIGGSLIGDATAVDTIVRRPQNFYWNFPTDEEGDAYAERRVMKLMDHCAGTARRFLVQKKLDRSKVRKTEVILSNMWMVIQGANESNLQSHSVPMLINEELWKWTPGMYLQAKARTDYFAWRSKIINISQAGVKGCEMDQVFKSGTQEEWEVKCVHCGKYHPLELSRRLPGQTVAGKPVYAGLSWDTNEKTKPNSSGGSPVWNFDAVKPTAHYVCPHCRKKTPDDAEVRRRWDDSGRYRVLNANASREERSFHIPSLACPMVPMGRLVEEYLKAKDQEKIGNLIPLMEYYMKRWAWSYDPDKHRTFEPVPTIVLESLNSDASGVASLPRKFWEKQDYIFLTVDVQRDCFWGMAQAWCNDGTSMILWAGRLVSWEDVAEKQEEFEIPDGWVFVDSRYRQNEVYIECASHGHIERRAEGLEWVCWNAVQGDPRRAFGYVPRTGPEAGRKIELPYRWPPHYADPCTSLANNDPLKGELQGRFCPLIAFAKGQIDVMANGRLELLERGEVSLVARADWEEELSKQLRGEVLDVQISPLGHEISKFRKVGPNHLLDCFRISILAAAIAEIIGPHREQ